MRKTVTFLLSIIALAIAMLAVFATLSGCVEHILHPTYHVGSHAKIRYDERSPVLNVYAVSNSGGYVYCEYTDSIGHIDYVVIDTASLVHYAPTK